VVDEARRRGITVWLCPAYLGWGGGDQGFFTEIAAAGAAALRDYGRFVGHTFKDLPNIVWMLGGDYAFPSSYRWLGDQLAAGLRDGGARQLMSAHGGQTTAVDTFGDRPWLTIDTVYSYAADLRPAMIAAFDRRPRRPFVLIESVYEGEHDSAREQIRRQAWTATLSGAAGQFFGNNPIWHFDGPALFPIAGSWREALASAGSRDMARHAAFLRAHRSAELEPDRDGSLINVGGAAPPIATAFTVGRTLALAYFPANRWNGRELSLNLRAFPRAMSVQWFDPAGDQPPRDGGTVKGRIDGQRLSMPSDARATADWVLLLEAR
jgi:hypothetical protein